MTNNKERDTQSSPLTKETNPILENLAQKLQPKIIRLKTWGR